MKVENVDIAGRETDERTKKIVTFETTDSNEAVMLFYIKAFGGSDWRADDIHIDETNLRYFTFQGSRAPQMYTFELSISKPYVQIRLGYDPGR